MVLTYLKDYNFSIYCINAKRTYKLPEFEIVKITYDTTFSETIIWEDIRDILILSLTISS